MVLLMSFVTLSFFVTRPECWVPSLGNVDHGFPFLSGAGLLVAKDHDGRRLGRDERFGKGLFAKEW